MTGPDGEEKIWVALTTQFPDVPVTARKEVRAILGTVGTVVQLLKLRGFEGRKVAQC